MFLNAIRYTVRGRQYQFAPLPDITAEQLAHCVRFMLYVGHASLSNSGTLADVDACWDTLRQEDKSHFAAVEPIKTGGAELESTPPDNRPASPTAAGELN